MLFWIAAAANLSYAQTLEWVRQFGTATADSANGIAADSTGVYVVGAVTGALPGQNWTGAISNAYIRKYDTSGGITWTRQFGSLDASGAALDSTGLYVVGTGPLASVMEDNAYLGKYDANGNETWTRQLRVPVPATNSGSSKAVAVDATGIYVTGAFGVNIFVTRYSLNGTEIWTRTVTTRDRHYYPTGIAVDGSSVYAVGWTDGVLPGQTSMGKNDGYIKKYDLNGNEVWTHQFGTPMNDVADAVAADATGVYVVGSTSGTAFDPPGYAYLRKFSLTGAELWVRQLVHGGFSAVTLDSTGIYVGGSIDGDLPGQPTAGGIDALVAKYDAGGGEVWTRRFGSRDTDYIYSLAVNSGTLYAAGATVGSMPGERSAGSLDAFVAKLPTAPSQNQPVISAVVNGASFAPGIQNNSWITVRGANLASVARTWDAAREIIGGKLPTSLDGVSVSVNGKAAAVYYISPTQINALAPSDSAIGPVPVTVTNANGTSAEFLAAMQRDSPGFFVFEPQGGRYAAATLASGGYLGPPNLFGGALVTTPAKPRDVIVIYGTGFGATNPPVAADRIFSGAAPLTDRVLITIGGLPANTLFAGMSGAGLCQFNVEVPDVDDGDQALIATIGGERTQAGTFLAVKR